MPPELAERLEQTVLLDDGRALGYAELGAPDGRPLIWFHGTPSSRLEVVWLSQAAADADWRLVAFDRPGHGLSSPHPGAALVEVATDVAALADHLGLERFSVAGYSGGAPFALATAARRADRVERVGLVSPWGPPDRPAAYDGVAWFERLSDGVARRWPAVTAALFGGLGLALRAAPGSVARALSRKLEGGELAGADDQSLAVETLAPLREALRQGGGGPARDLHLIVRPWGFDVAEVVAPVRIWHGDHDPEIPLHHAQYLQGALADASLEILTGGDHLALFARGQHILGALAESAG